MSIARRHIVVVVRDNIVVIADVIVVFEARGARVDASEPAVAVIATYDTSVLTQVHPQQSPPSYPDTSAVQYFLHCMDHTKKTPSAKLALTAAVAKWLWCTLSPNYITAPTTLTTDDEEYNVRDGTSDLTTADTELTVGAGYSTFHTTTSVTAASGACSK